MTTHRCIGTGKNECIKKIDIITKMYTNRGFNISPYNGDKDFEMLREHVGGKYLNIFGRENHVGVIECSIWTIKERTRLICYKVPYKHYTKLMTEEIILGVTKMLNVFSNKEDIGINLSPDAIVLGTQRLYYNNIKLSFGTYVNLHDGTDNSTKSRVVGDIALRSPNEHGSYYCMSLRTGKKLNSSRWTQLPITDEVIDRIKNMCIYENQDMTKQN